MTDLTQIQASTINSGLKSFIVGKMWLTSKDGSRPGCIRISRYLPKDIVLKPSVTLFIHQNNKRAGKADADYSISVLLPTAVTDNLIAQERLLSQQGAVKANAEAPVAPQNATF